MHDHLAGHVVARVADPGGIRDFLDVGEIVLRTPGSDRLVEELAVRDPAGIGGEPLVVGQVVARSMISRATRCHSRSLVVPSTTVCPSRVGKAPYGATAGEPTPSGCWSMPECWV